MASEWRDGMLGDIADIVMGTSPPGETCNTAGVGEPLLNGPTEFGLSTPTPVQYTTQPTRRSQPGDTLFYVRGSTTGRMNWADQSYILGRGLAAIRHKQGIDYRHFVRAVIDHNLADLLAAATGSTFPCVSGEQIARMQVSYPSLTEQRAIAGVLGALDDKIAANRQLSGTLEALARRLFRSWFVDFDPVVAKAAGRRPVGVPAAAAKLFPAAFADSPLGLIPEGWRVGTVGEDFRLTMGQSPPGSTYNEIGEGLHFYQGRTDFTTRFPTRRVYCTAPTRFADVGDTLVSVRAPVGDINMAMDRCAVGRGLASVRHKSGSRSFTYYSMDAQRDAFAEFEGHGTLFGAINGPAFAGLKCVVPPAEIVTLFDEFANPMDARIETTERQSRTLAALRDALLPRLLSGELRVRDAAKLTGEVLA